EGWKIGARQQRRRLIARGKSRVVSRRGAAVLVATERKTRERHPHRARGCADVAICWRSGGSPFDRSGDTWIGCPIPIEQSQRRFEFPQQRLVPANELPVPGQEPQAGMDA